MKRSVMSPARLRAIVSRAVIFLRARCRCLFDKHVVVLFVEGPYEGIGDGYDRFGVCVHCGKTCTSDSHLYGDDEWRSIEI